jgi:hypothetical protein
VGESALVSFCHVRFFFLTNLFIKQDRDYVPPGHPYLPSARLLPVRPVQPVEPPPFTVTILRQVGPEPEDLQIHLEIPGCRPTDLMETFLKRAVELDKNFDQGLLTWMTFSIQDRDPQTEAQREPLKLIVFHLSVKKMMLWEVGISATNTVALVRFRLSR